MRSIVWNSQQICWMSQHPNSWINYWSRLYCEIDAFDWIIIGEQKHFLFPTGAGWISAVRINFQLNCMLKLAKILLLQV